MAASLQEVSGKSEENHDGQHCGTRLADRYASLNGPASRPWAAAAFRGPGLAEDNALMSHPPAQPGEASAPPGQRIANVFDANQVS